MRLVGLSGGGHERTAGPRACEALGPGGRGHPPSAVHLRRGRSRPPLPRLARTWPGRASHRCRRQSSQNQA
eukprot:3384320-Pyramimonas_sp.AAC.1